MHSTSTDHPRTHATYTNTATPPATPRPPHPHHAATPPRHHATPRPPGSGLAMPCNWFYGIFISTIWVIHMFQDVESQITTVVDAFGDELESLMCDGLRVGGDKCSNGKYGIQDFIYSFESHFDSDVSDASVIAQSIIDRLDSKLHQRAAFLTNLSSVIRSECISKTQDDETFGNLYFSGNADLPPNLPNDMQYSDVYGRDISLTASTYQIPNGMDPNNANIKSDARVSLQLDNTMRDLYDRHCISDDEYCSMYFGTINGVFRFFPGIATANDDYDPRFRPWYVSAATGSKDVVILLDVSHSMAKHNRLTLAKEAVISVLHTLGSSSFVNVVAFSDSLTLSCFGRTLVSATARNVAELVDFVDHLQTSGSTDFTKAFTAAFDILQSAEHCQTVILFLTDGAAEDVSALIQERNTVDINAVVFSFTLGDEANATVPERVASLTNGIYTHIDDDDDNLITVMSSYYLYFAYGGSTQHDIIITSPYLDFDTEVVMITMAIPVYINDTYFVGVVGTDIPLFFLSDAIGDITIGRKSYTMLINEESEVLLHPFIPDAFELLDANEEYKAIFVKDVEPEAYVTSILQHMIKREAGATRITASVQLPAAAGDLTYHTELLYIYAGVGPSSLSIAIVAYSESDVESPNVAAFGMKSSPNVDCDAKNSSDLSECVAPFSLFHRLDLMMKCQSDWLSTAQVLNSNDSSNANLHYNAFYEGKLYTVQYPTFYIQSGLYERQLEALHNDPTCAALIELHRVSNRMSGYNVDDLPFGGPRQEISGNLLNSIYTLSSLHEFWKPVFLSNTSLFVSMYFGHYQGLHFSYPGKQFQSTYNNHMRPWYQRAISYPDLMVWVTPYRHATTQKLVMSASTVVFAPNSDYAYGVAAFDYEYSSFVHYWKRVMASACDLDHCYLIDSSAFCLYYEGMERNPDDEDIGRKFLGDVEPTLMQSLLDRNFFINATNVNFQDDTIVLTYMVDPTAHLPAFASVATSFAYNDGKYTVHAVSNTNLFVVHIADYWLLDV